MTDRGQIAISLQSFEHYLTCWDRPEVRQAAGVSSEEAAYHLLEHAGKLHRYKADEHFTRGLGQLAPDARKRLVLAACRYADGLQLADRCRGLLAADVLDQETLEQIDAVVLHRDALGIVLNVANDLSEDLQEDEEVVLALGGALILADDIANLLYEREDVISVAWRILADEPGGRPAWLRRAAALDQAFETRELAEWLSPEGQQEPPTSAGRIGPTVGQEDDGVSVVPRRIEAGAPGRMLRFSREQPTDPRLVASEAQGGVVQLWSDEGARVRVFSLDPGACTLHLVGVDIRGRLSLAVGGRPVPWLRPPDEDGYGVVREADIDPVLKDQAVLEVTLEP